GSSFGASFGISLGWTISVFCTTTFGLIVFFFTAEPPPAGGGGAGGGGGAADRNVTLSSGGDSSSMCQNEYAIPTAISAPWTPIDSAYHRRLRPARAGASDCARKASNAIVSSSRPARRPRASATR